MKFSHKPFLPIFLYIFLSARKESNYDDKCLASTCILKFLLKFCKNFSLEMFGYEN